MTFGQLKATVTEYLDRPELGDLAGKWINLAMKRTERKNNFRCMELRQQSASSNETKISLPDRYKELISMRVLYDDRYISMRRETKESIYDVYPSETGTIGIPELYATMIAHNEILIRPTPNRSYVYDLHSYLYSTELAGESETNWWTLNGWEILLYGALCESILYSKNIDKAAYYEQKYQEAVQSLYLAETGEQWTGGNLSVGQQITPPS